MGLFDRFFGSGNREMILDAAVLEKWPDRLIRQQLLHEHLDEYLYRVEKKRDKVAHLHSKIADPSLKERVPERARPILEEHVALMSDAIAHLLKATNVIRDLFLIEEQQEDFRDAISTYRRKTEKSRSALREFLESELHELDQAIRSLEDAMLSITPVLEEKHFSNIKQAKKIIEEYKSTRQKEKKLQHLHELLRKELDTLEEKRIKHKEKIRYFMERAKSSRFKELLAEEESLLEKVDEIKVRDLPPEVEEQELHPLTQRLAFLRKQMINDITAMNINEQRTFLEATKDNIRLRRRKLERVEEMLQEVSWQQYRLRLMSALEPFNVRIEDVERIIERGEDDVAPQ